MRRTVTKATIIGAAFLVLLSTFSFLFSGCFQLQTSSAGSVIFDIKASRNAASGSFDFSETFITVELRGDYSDSKTQAFLPDADNQITFSEVPFGKNISVYAEIYKMVQNKEGESVKTVCFKGQSESQLINEGARVSLGDGVLLTGNRGEMGGAIYNLGTLFIYGSTIIGNKNAEVCPPTSNSEVTVGGIVVAAPSNYSNNSGGAIYNAANSKAYISSGSIARNTANSGGGIYNNANSSSIFVMAGGTINKNTAESTNSGQQTARGGGLLMMVLHKQ